MKRFARLTCCMLPAFLCAPLAVMAANGVSLPEGERIWPNARYDQLQQLAAAENVVALRQPLALAAGPRLDRWVSAGISAQNLNAGYPSWSGQYLRGWWQTDEKNKFYFELEHASRFDESGTLGGLTWVRTLDADWFATLGFTGTTGADFWPASTWRASINRRWLADRSLVTTLAAGQNVARNGYRDRPYEVSVSYYTQYKFVMQAGLLGNTSDPGSVNTYRGFAALTWGERGQQYYSIRVSSGGEGYQQLGTTTITDFRSDEVELGTRQWIGRDWGVDLRAFWYRNPYYDRYGVEAGVFKDL